MSYADVAEFRCESWKTIATGGANKIEPGQFRGTGARANRGSDSRVIHFRDGDAYLDYQQQFGERAIYDVMTGHVQGVAKDIAAIAAFGTNPDHNCRMLRGRAYQRERKRTRLNSSH